MADKNTPSPWPSQASSGRVVVAGHLCLDLTPEMLNKRLPAEGGLVLSGPLGISSGGAVPNVGLALMRLGEQVRLVGNMGDDALATLMRTSLSAAGEQNSLRAVAGAATSYSVVIAQGGMDRLFIHCPGANETFTSEAVSTDDLKSGRWLHFGYPPLLPAMCENEGAEMDLLFSRARDAGLRTSLDFCSIDPFAEKTVKWDRVFANCGPKVTVFAPGLEEVGIALDIPACAETWWLSVSQVSTRLLSFGFAIVVLKLGSNGLYLRSTADAAQLASWNLGPEWAGRELFTPCFDAALVNANGAGDCTIAGLIASISRGYTPEQTIAMAAAVGACSVEASDASSGVRHFDAVVDRIQKGWNRRGASVPAESWKYDPFLQLWQGPQDRELEDLRPDEVFANDKR